MSQNVLRSRLESDPRAHAEPRRLVLLGATGSVGRSTADLIEAADGQFSVEAIAGGQDAQALARMAIRLKARFVALHEPEQYGDLKSALAGRGFEIAAGAAAVEEAALRSADLVIAAIAGTAGVAPTYAALRRGQTVALANKECLVCAGAAVMRAARLSGAMILPLDSEHNAIFQILSSYLGDGSRRPSKAAGPRLEIEQMTLTASGGPFRTWDAARIATATRAEALAHPNWSMGKKITIDSASLMNKGLELIEAHYLFGIEPARLEVLVHPQSVIHGLVSFADGSVLAGMAHPDMKVPIAHCLAYPHRMTTQARRLDLAQLAKLTFERPDLERFPALSLAIEALKSGDGLPTVLNAANEVAVAAFLAGTIGFGAIAGLVEATCNACVADRTAHEPATVDDALAVDHVARERARTLLAETRSVGIVTNE
jgi:1-deoxy-D-xylulose-5-phosphate reductoisomerase